MKIEIGKKYKTRNGEDVKVYAVHKDTIHGAIKFEDCWRGYSWCANGCFLLSQREHSNDLVEAKEDWEILVEHFKNGREDILVLVEDLLILIHGVKLQDYQDYFSVFYGDGLHINTWKGGVKIATLEDCKKYILEG